MSAHTPGPWRVGPCRQILADSNLGAMLLADTFSGGPGVDIADANARRIAAAPEMAAALEQIADVPRSINESDCWPREWQMIQLARATIARAKGEA